MIERRRFLAGLTGLICAPAIVRVASLMAVRPLPTIYAVDLAIGDDSTSVAIFEFDRTGLLRIRDILKPGLADWKGRYETLPTQWGEVFNASAP